MYMCVTTHTQPWSDLPKLAQHDAPLVLVTLSMVERLLPFWISRCLHGLDHGALLVSCQTAPSEWSSHCHVTACGVFVRDALPHSHLVVQSRRDLFCCPRKTRSEHEIRRSAAQVGEDVSGTVWSGSFLLRQHVWELCGASSVAAVPTSREHATSREFGAERRCGRTLRSAAQKRPIPQDMDERVCAQYGSVCLGVRRCAAVRWCGGRGCSCASSGMFCGVGTTNGATALRQVSLHVKEGSPREMTLEAPVPLGNTQATRRGAVWLVLRWRIGRSTRRVPSLHVGGRRWRRRARKG